MRARYWLRAGGPFGLAACHIPVEWCGQMRQVGNAVAVPAHAQGGERDLKGLDVPPVLGGQLVAMLDAGLG
jgi:hypothetical protein